MEETYPSINTQQQCRYISNYSKQIFSDLPGGPSCSRCGPLVLEEFVDKDEVHQQVQQHQDQDGPVKVRNLRRRAISIDETYLQN